VSIFFTWAVILHYKDQVIGSVYRSTSGLFFRHLNISSWLADPNPELDEYLKQHFPH
jgi:hypothetical protein